MSLALHGKSELELAAQKALELLDYVSDITTVDGKILAIMGLITGLSGQAKVSHILFEQAKICLLYTSADRGYPVRIGNVL